MPATVSGSRADALMLRPSGAGPAGNDRQQRGAVAVELAAADAGNGGEFAERGGAAAGDFDQGRVVEDDVGRQLLAPRLVEAPRAQRLPQRLRGGIKRGFAIPPLAPLAARPPVEAEADL